MPSAEVEKNHYSVNSSIYLHLSNNQNQEENIDDEFYCFVSRPPNHVIIITVNNYIDYEKT